MNFAVIDLVAAAAALPLEHKKLSKLILQLRDSHSIRTDLTLANDFLSTMQVIGHTAAGDGAGEHAENSFLALFYSALLLYVRATKTQHDSRRSFDFTKDYDATEKVKHAVLCDLRDKALAHYGTGGTYNGPAFQTESVFIPYGKDEEPVVVSASQRLVIQPQIIADLKQMAHRGLMLADKRTQNLNQMVVAALIVPAAASEVFPILREHVTCLTKFAGSAEAAELIMQGPRVGYRRGTARH